MLKKIASAQFLALCLVSCKNDDAPTHKYSRNQSFSAAKGDGAPSASVEATPAAHPVEPLVAEPALNLTAATLYEFHCSPCHGPLDNLSSNPDDPMTRSLRGKSSEDIISSIRRVPQMSEFSYLLNAEQIDLIAQELSALELPLPRPSDPEPSFISPVSEDYSPKLVSSGQAYQAYCSDASCHGQADSSSMRVRSFTAFREAMERVPAMKELGDLQRLTQNQVEDLLKD